MKSLSTCLLAVTLTACGGASSPSAPTPQPSTPAQPIQTALVFTPETTTPAANTVSIRTESGEPRSFDPLRLSIMANDIRVRVVSFSATLRYNTHVIRSVETFTSGDFMKQGGALTVFDVRFDDDSGEYTIQIDRPDTIPGALGSGELLVLQFHAAPGVHNLDSALQWTDIELETADFDDVLARTYAGTVHVE